MFIDDSEIAPTPKAALQCPALRRSATAGGRNDESEVRELGVGGEARPALKRPTAVMLH